MMFNGEESVIKSNEITLLLKFDNDPFFKYGELISTSCEIISGLSTKI